MSPVKTTRASVSSKVVQFFEIKPWIFDYHLWTEFQFNSSILKFPIFCEYLIAEFNCTFFLLVTISKGDHDKSEKVDEVLFPTWCDLDADLTFGIKTSSPTLIGSGNKKCVCCCRAAVLPIGWCGRLMKWIVPQCPRDHRQNTIEKSYKYSRFFTG